MCRVLALLILAACGRLGFSSGTVDGDAGVTTADAIETCVPHARACSCWTYAPSNFDPCNSCAPTMMSPLAFPAGTYVLDTDANIVGSEVQDQGGLPVRVVFASSMTVGAGATVTIHGSLPLILAIEGDVLIDGTIDGGATATRSGPGGGLAVTCVTATGGDAGGNGGDIYGGSGGGGGGFGTIAGAGGDGWGVGAQGNGGLAGSAIGAAAITPLRGGCRGGRGRAGWVSTGSQLAGVGGYAGGAIQISTCASASISGTIDTHGGGGTGGGKNPATFRSGGGGAGGGAGGAIVMEANDLQIIAGAGLCANGGSGGEGGSETLDGASGAAGTCSTTTAANTVDSVPEGGNGGPGGVRASAAGTGVVGSPQNGGGGGGGGAVGRIRLFGAGSLTLDGGAVISPQQTP